MWRQIVKAPDTPQCPSRFQEKGPPALSPGTDPPSIERVLLGREGLPVLAFHLNQATSTNKALIINAFTECNTVPPPLLLALVPAKTSHKIDKATLLGVTIVVWNWSQFSAYLHHICLIEFILSWLSLFGFVLCITWVQNKMLFFSCDSWQFALNYREKYSSLIQNKEEKKPFVNLYWIVGSVWIQTGTAEFDFL